MKLGVKPIADTRVILKSRDDVPALVASLLKIYTTPEYNDKIFNILEKRILKGKKKTGRTGLSLWQIFVLAQFRLCLNLDYDWLHYMALSDSTLRQLLGIETETGFERIEFGYQRILDNVHLLDDETLREINDVVVEFGQGVFKKKEGEALQLKSDSFVVENTVHFPTDYNLLFDSMRKAMDTMCKFTDKYPSIEGWRKLSDWQKSLKNLSRAVGRASSSGGKNKAKRIQYSAKKYLTKAIAFRNKIKSSKESLVIEDAEDLVRAILLDRFIELTDKHIDLVDRRLLKGEKIPHEEKLFSIFEEYTEWINKGKSHPNVELGKMMTITTDQYGLIIDYRLMEHEADSEIVIEIADTVLQKYSVDSWSFDKGYYKKENKDLLQLEIPNLIMPKKGKLTKLEKEEEHEASFKKSRNMHSAVESNINELEHNGLDKCPDKGYHGFKRYVSIGIVAHNLHRIGKQLIKLELAKQKKKERLRQAA